MSLAPMWPDFEVKDQGGGKWMASTCTLRPPVTNGHGQVFNVWIHDLVGYLNEAEATEELRQRLVRSYVQAHPNNCANTPAELLEA